MAKSNARDAVKILMNVSLAIMDHIVLNAKQITILKLFLSFKIDVAPVFYHAKNATVQELIAQHATREGSLMKMPGHAFV